MHSIHVVKQCISIIPDPESGNYHQFLNTLNAPAVFFRNHHSFLNSRSSGKSMKLMDSNYVSYCINHCRDDSDVWTACLP